MSTRAVRAPAWGETTSVYRCWTMWSALSTLKSRPHTPVTPCRGTLPSSARWVPEVPGLPALGLGVPETGALGAEGPGSALSTRSGRRPSRCLGPVLCWSSSLLLRHHLPPSAHTCCGPSLSVSLFAAEEGTAQSVPGVLSLRGGWHLRARVWTPGTRDVLWGPLLSLWPACPRGCMEC